MVATTYAYPLMLIWFMCFIRGHGKSACLQKVVILSLVLPFMTEYTDLIQILILPVWVGMFRISSPKKLLKFADLWGPAYAYRLHIFRNGWQFGTSKISAFAHINSYNKSFTIDYPLLLYFNHVQGYAPFSDVTTLHQHSKLLKLPFFATHQVIFRYC